MTFDGDTDVSGNLFSGPSPGHTGSAEADGGGGGKGGGMEETPKVTACLNYSRLMESA